MTHTGSVGDHTLDCFELEPNAAHFDLVVAPTLEPELSVSIGHNDITCGVPRRTIIARRHRGGRQVGIAPIALHHCRSRHPQFSGFADTDGLAVFVDHQNLDAIPGLPDRNLAPIAIERLTEWFVHSLTSAGP